MAERKIYILVTAALSGFFVIVQSRSFDTVNELLQRDASSNIFQEIQILKDTNSDLKKETGELENTIKQLTDQGQALNSIQEEIDKYAKLSGKSSVFGPGVSVEINGKITTPWVIDLINELFNSGAQAVSVNNIRIINRTVGFDTLPQGQILLNGSVLSAPYVFNAIGEPSPLANILDLPGGIFERMKKTFPEAKISIVKKEIIQMN